MGDQVQAETEALMKFEMLPLGTSSNLIMHLVEIIHLICLRLEQPLWSSPITCFAP